ncbi:MAG: NnrS family protein [Rhizobium sp.]|nr:NnrS family protein [Rhizobium sp.]
MQGLANTGRNAGRPDLRPDAGGGDADHGGGQSSRAWSRREARQCHDRRSPLRHHDRRIDPSDAGAAFLDRVAEGFVGREAFKAELAALWLSSALAGAGLVLAGLSYIGLPLPFVGVLHLMLMGGLGLGMLAVLSIAGLLHTGQPLVFAASTRIAILLMLGAVLLRVAPEFIPGLSLPGGQHGLAAICWTLSLALWLKTYLPLLWSSATLASESC